MARDAFWVLHRDALMAMLRRVQAGEDPEVVYDDALIDCRIDDAEGKDSDE